MSLPTLKYLFFFIVGVNILITILFLNASNSSPFSNTSSIQMTTNTVPEINIDNSNEKQYDKKDLKPIESRFPITNLVGNYLQSSGKPSYLDNKNNSNYGDLKRAKEDIKNLKALKELKIGLNKSTYTQSEVMKLVLFASDNVKKGFENAKNDIFKNVNQLIAKYDLVDIAFDRIINDLSMANLFRYYDLYTYNSQEYFNGYPGAKPKYNKTFYGILKDQSYCDISDIYNLNHPENVLNNMNFVVDYTHGAIVRDDVCTVIGYDAMPEISMIMKDVYKPRYPLNVNATLFFTKRINFHIYHEISVNFLCMAQEYGHIPGNGVLTRKDLNVKAVNEYAKRYNNNTKCFNQQMFFPMAFRLNIIDECKEFFNFISSKKYESKKVTEPLQFILKAGHSKHRAMGLYLFDEELEKKTIKDYKNGEKCGQLKESLLAQQYISNPLLLDKENKFDFRMYMLIASVNPLIVYYHDGFLRLSLQKYDKFSKEKNVHFTNTHLSKQLFALAKKQKEYLGMTEDQLREYQMWTMEDLSEYLNEIGKVHDKKWLDNYLRPKFQEAFIHTVRMAEKYFLKHSGVFEMFGLDFLLDDELNLWFIECNASPQLIGTSTEKHRFLKNLLTDVFQIQHAYLRSRFKRILAFMTDLKERIIANDGKPLDKKLVQEEFAEINMNKLEPEYQIKNNSFVLIMDKSIKGPDAYFGHLKEECIDDL